MSLALNKKTKIELAVIGGGVLVVAVLLPGNLGKLRPAGRPVPRGGARAPVEQTAPSAPVPPRTPAQPSLNEELLEQKRVLREAWGKSPFVRGTPAGPKASASGPQEIILHLKGVSTPSGGPALGIINETIVQEGDAIEGYRVKEIHPDFVVLEQGEQEKVLKLDEEEGSPVTERKR